MTKNRPSLLVGNIREAKGLIVTDTEKKEVVFRGSIGFKAVYGRKGLESLNLIRLNLHTKGVKSTEGFTGTIGLKLSEPDIKTKFDLKSGALRTSFQSTLHYPLIDRKQGFRDVQKVTGDTCFVPYTETVKGKLEGQLPKGLKADSGQGLHAEFEVVAEIAEHYVRAIREFRCVVVLDLNWLFSAAEVLRIQPVFIGTGPDDATATGTSYLTLMRRAASIWSRCGSERCISFSYNPAIYIDEDQYRTIENETEFWDFSHEISVYGAVEVFFAERFEESYAVSMGGGAAYGAGEASAGIVTCDQQLDVPCPPPCGYGSCGDVNYYHLAHELGHVLNLDHPDGRYGLAPSTVNSVMEGSGFCLDNPNAQSAMNCRNASSSLLYWGESICWGTPDIDD